MVMVKQTMKKMNRMKESEIEEEPEPERVQEERRNAIAVVSGAVNGVNILPDEWLAIKYQRDWYVGQFLEYDEEVDLIHIHFLKKVSSSSPIRFVWPELQINGKEDKAYVEESK